MPLCSLGFCNAARSAASSESQRSASMHSAWPPHTQLLAFPPATTPPGLSQLTDSACSRKKKKSAARNDSEMRHRRASVRQAWETHRFSNKNTNTQARWLACGARMRDEERWTAHSAVCMPPQVASSRRTHSGPGCRGRGADSRWLTRDRPACWLAVHAHPSSSQLSCCSLSAASFLCLAPALTSSWDHRPARTAPQQQPMSQQPPRQHQHQRHPRPTPPLQLELLLLLPLVPHLPNGTRMRSPCS